MDAHDDRFAILISIHPEYSQPILAGTKRVELRKRRPAVQPRYLLIYETAPTSALVGLAEVIGIDEATPAELWTRHGSVAGIGRGAFDRYYEGRASGIAFRLGRVHRFADSVPLGRFAGAATPPQSYQYVSRRSVEPLLHVCSA